MDDDPLAIELETMRALGYRTVDFLVERAARERGEPALRTAPREEMEARLLGPPSEEPIGYEDLLQRLGHDVLPFLGRFDHPRFFGFIPGSATWTGVLGDLVASGCNIDTGSWRESAGPSQLELVVLDWFKEWIGYPAAAAGVLVSGGSAANMTALACAREALLGAMSTDVVAYLSDQAHASMARACRILGFRPEQVRVLPADGRFRMRPDTLVEAMDSDQAAGRRPMFVGAAAGSTSTGAVDPLPELAEVCRARGVWLHVDAAYGGFAVLAERGKRWLAGLELADSVTLDPHKWLYQPFEVGCLLIREGRLLRRAFEITPDHLRDTQAVSREVNFTNFGMQLTRMARAIKVWISIQYFGVGAFRRAVDRSIDLALAAQERIERTAAFELLSPATLGVVCFRRRFDGVQDEPALGALNWELIRALVASGRGVVSSTRLRGRFAIRLCVMNHNSTARDVEEVLDWLEHHPVEVATAMTAFPAPADEREPGVNHPWLAGPGLEAGGLREIPLFRELTDEQVAAVLAAARTSGAAPRERVITQWEYAREFYVILEGEVVVRSGQGPLATLGPGDFFGELGALEWGAGYGYPRTASVAARTPVRLLVLPGQVLNDLVRDAPTVGDRIRAAMRDRLSAQP
jgi:glutamate/tyrosine decarboxylase-like PLP-dependent enzyme